MKEYTSNSPVFSESIEIPEATDTNHVNNLNPAPMQLLQNTLVNKKAIENIGQDITSSADAVYQQSTGYTDTKIAELINGAPSTLDTLGEIAQAMQENENVVDALDKAMGSKAPQAELDGHTGNSTIHITASERTGWNNKLEKTGDASNTTAAFTQASSLANISTGEKISVIMGKVSKAIATLISHVAEKATGSKFGHVKLSDTYKSAVSNGAAANGVGASQKAVANAYSALNNSLGGLEFAQDAEGNWGYKPAGADTVTPFKKEAKLPNITITAQARVAYVESSYTPTIGVYVPAGYTKMTLSGATGAVSMYLNSAVLWDAVTGNGTYTIPANTTRITCRLRQPTSDGEYGITLTAG